MTKKACLLYTSRTLAGTSDRVCLAVILEEVVQEVIADDLPAGTALIAKGFCEAIASFARMILICMSADGSDTLIFLLMATPPMDHDIHNPFSGSDSPVVPSG